MKLRLAIPITVFFTLTYFIACRHIENNTYAKTVWSQNQEQDLWEKATTYLFPQSKEQLLEETGATKAQIELGKTLFYEKKLSLNENQSCNTCHNLDNYGVDNEQFSKGSRNNTIGVRNTPTVFDAAFHYAQFWDGRAKTVEEQAAFPILNPNEMAMPSEESVVARLKAMPEYIEKFNKAYPDEMEALSFANITHAIGAFERTLVTNSRFDDYTAGNLDALTPKEKKGLRLFLDLNCAPCHSGSTVGGLMPQRFGQVGNYDDYTGHPNPDRGIAEISNAPADENTFKVPSLRNVVHTAPYFHDGSVETLEEAISIMAKAQLNTELSNEDILSIKAFLNSLSLDDSAL